MKRTGFYAVVVLAFGGSLGWLAASGPQVAAFANDKSTNTTQANGSQLPKPDPEFKGKIGETYKEVKPTGV